MQTLQSLELSFRILQCAVIQFFVCACFESFCYRWTTSVASLSQCIELSGSIFEWVSCLIWHSYQEKKIKKSQWNGFYFTLFYQIICSQQSYTFLIIAFPKNFLCFSLNFIPKMILLLPDAVEKANRNEGCCPLPAAVAGSVRHCWSTAILLSLELVLKKWRAWCWSLSRLPATLSHRVVLYSLLDS